MPRIEIRPEIWEGLKAAAARRGQRLEVLVNQILQEFLERLSDEELLVRSEAGARRAAFRLGRIEMLIRRYRDRR